MPLGRYFVVAGSLLIALLLIANVCLPKASESYARPDVDKGIRITSPQRWPEKIVFDTRAPAVSPAADAGAAQFEAASPNGPEGEAVAGGAHLEAFARLRRSAAPKAKHRLSDDSKRSRLLHVRRPASVAANPTWPPLPAAW